MKIQNNLLWKHQFLFGPNAVRLLAVPKYVTGSARLDHRLYFAQVPKLLKKKIATRDPESIQPFWGEGIDKIVVAPSSIIRMPITLLAFYFADG